MSNTGPYINLYRYIGASVMRKGSSEMKRVSERAVYESILHTECITQSLNVFDIQVTFRKEQISSQPT